MAQAGTATVKFVGDYSQMNAGLASALAPAKLKGAGMKAGLAVGGAFAGAFIGSKVVDEIGKAVSVTKAFDKEISSLKAVAGASAREIDRLRKQAIKMGADTVFSATEAAEAQTELAKGGLNASQILGGALKSSLDLAAAGELNLADAAETTVNAMQLFGMEGRSTSRIADMLATAANKTTADVLDFAMSLKMGGSVAKTAGYSLNDTVIILEALAEAGIKNSDAGTSMKTSLIQLLNPTAKQAKLAEQLGISWLKQNGELKNGIQISKELRKATDGMTKAERTKTFAVLAGTDGFRTLSALYDAGVGKLRDYSRANQEQGTAAETAREKTDNLAGDVEELAGAYETLQITVGSKVTPVLRELTQVGTDVLRWTNGALTGLDKEVGDTGKSWKQLGDDVFEIGKAFAQTPFDPDGGIKRFLNVISGEDGKEVSDLQQVTAARIQAARSLQRVTRISSRARGRAVNATREENRAERALKAARERHGDGSAEVIRAEVRLQRAKRRTIRLTREARLAERLQGVERRVVMARTRDAVLTEKTRITVLNRQVRALGRQWDAERRINGNSKRAQQLEGQIINRMKRREGSQKRLNDALSSASRQIGPKFAKSLQSISGRMAAVEKAMGRIPQPARNAKQALGAIPAPIEKIGRTSRTHMDSAEKSLDSFKEASTGLRRVFNRNMRAMPEPTAWSMDEINRSLRAQLESIQNIGTPQAKRRGGLVEWARQKFRGGGMPVALSPGEMYKTPSGRSGIVPGRPTAADNVLTSMPVGTKIFTFDGQRRLAEGASEGEALRNQLPHFAEGGIVKPEIKGGTPLSNKVANRAVGKAHSAATARWKWLKENMVGDLDSVTRLARKYGLQVTSGFRPGDDGWHGSNRARDYSNSTGPTPQMYAFAKFLYDNHASKLLELIYTPLGAAVKNYQRTGTYAEADHYNHVHVAMRGGGLVRNPWFDKRTKKGNINGVWPSADLAKNPSGWFALPTLPGYVIGALAEAAGRHFNIDVPGRTMMQMVMGEGAAKPGSQGTDPGGRTKGYGLWAVTTGFDFNDKLVRRFGGTYGHQNNPVLNAAAMAHIYKSQGTGAWYGDSHVTDFNAHWRGSYQLRNALGGIGYAAALRSALRGKFDGDEQDSGPSPAQQRKSRKGKREKQVRDLIQKAFATRSVKAKKGNLWQILDLYAKYGDFGTMPGGTVAGGVAPGQRIFEAVEFLSRAKGIAGIVDPNRGAGQLYNLVKWLQGNVDLTGAKKANDNLSDRLKRVRKMETARAAKKRKRILSRISGKGLDYPQKKNLIRNDRIIRTKDEWIELAMRDHTSETSAGGSEYTDSEVDYEKRLNLSLLGSLQDRKGMLARSMKFITRHRDALLGQLKTAPAFKRQAIRKGIRNSRQTLGDLRTNWEELVGLTGRGGRIGDVKATLAELGVRSTVEKQALQGISIGDLRQIIEFAGLGGYDNMPKFHGGGIYRAPSGQSEGPALLRDGETVRTPQQERALGGDVKVEVNFADGMGWLADFVDVRVIERERANDQFAKAGGV